MLIKRTMPLSQLLGNEMRPRGLSVPDLFETSVDGERRSHVFAWPEREVDEPGMLPLIAVPANGDAEGFFADVATFYPNFSPISAYMYVLGKGSPRGLEELESLTKRSSITGYTNRESQTSLWIALTIAEAATTAQKSARGEPEVTYSVCRRTMAFALARAAFIYPGYDLALVASKWAKLRELAKMNYGPELAASILWITQIVFGNDLEGRGFGGSDIPLKASIRRLYDRDISPREFASQLAAAYPGISGHIPTIEGNYDRRMDALNGIIQAIQKTNHSPELDALAIAFFCNMILPGSFSHIRLLARLIETYPSILIWYGLFSANSETFDWKRVMAGIGQKLARDLLAPFNWDARPTSDITIDELDVLSRTSLSVGVIKPLHDRSLVVSLLPGIDVLARWPGDSETQGRSIIQDEHARAERDSKIRWLLGQAQQLLDEPGEPTKAGNHASQKSLRKGRKSATRDFER